MNVIDGDTSDMAILLVDSKSSSITNNTIEGGEHGIKAQNSTNVFIYNNTIKDNSGNGVYLLLGSHSGNVKYNTVKSNEDDAISIQSSDNVEVIGNTLTDNNGYGILAGNSKLVEFKNNTLSILTSSIFSLQDKDKNNIPELLKNAEEEATKKNLNDQAQYLIDQKIEVLKSIN